MTPETREDVGALAALYAQRLDDPRPGPALGRGFDEFVQGRRLRPGSGMIVQALDRFGTMGLQSRRRLIERLIADEGITYGGVNGQQGPRPWALDPLPLVVESDDWHALDRGLRQRARLLDAILTDLTGARSMLATGIVPAGVVAAHPGLLPAAAGVPSPQRRALPLLAMDVARSADGSWTVLADRTQAPSGAGYAMANRRITARVLESVHRHAPLRRLRGWFDEVGQALADAAPPSEHDVPRIVLLTAGPQSETAYDQGLLATLLGHPLAQADDLLVRGGRLWLRTMGRLEAVDVLLRRVDADWCDALDLRADSRLGVPGLVAAARRGSVAVVNPLQAAVLENPGLLPFQEALAQHFLGEDLLLPVPTTWWCGDAASLSHALSHLDTLVIKPLDRGVGHRHILGWELSSAESDALRERIRSEPWAWTAQEPVASSTAPLVTGNGLQPRGVVVRTFAVAVGEDYHVMPGGLARVATDPQEFSVTNAAGATSKDVWVLGEQEAEPPRFDRDVVASARMLGVEATLPGLTPRSASHLYWLGRYAERAEVTARLLMVADDLVEDHHGRPGTPGHAAMEVLLEAVSELMDAPLTADAQVPPQVRLGSLLVDPTVTGSVADSVGRAHAAALQVREVLALSTPSVLSRLQRVLTEARAESSVPVQYTSERILDSLLALTGLSAESLVRDATWGFWDAGRRVERAQATIRLLVSALGSPRSPIIEAQVVEAMLRVGDSLITYRRRMAAGVGPAQPVWAALSILLSDASNPRSILFQMDRLDEALASTPDVRLSERIGTLRRRLRDARLTAGGPDARVVIRAELEACERELWDLSDAIEAAHFTAQVPPSHYAVTELMGSHR